MSPKLVPLAATLLLAAAAFAQTTLPAPQPPADTTAFLTPWLDQSTLLVAHIDLDRLDFPAALRFLEQEFTASHVPVLAGPIKKIAAFRTQAQTLLTQAHALGARHLYFFVDQHAGIPDPTSFALLLPLDKATDPAPLLALLQSLNIPTLQPATLHPHLLALGTPNGLDHLTRITPTPRPDLLAAFTPLPSHDPAPFTLAFSVAGDFRRTLLDSSLTLPQTMGGGPVSPLINPLRSAGLSLDTPPGPTPDPSLTLLLTTDDRLSADHLAALLNDTLVLFSKALIADAEKQNDLFLKQQIPTLQRLPQLLAPAVNNRTVAIILNKDAVSQLTASLLLPGIAHAERVALRIRSMTNMRQIAMTAILNADKNGEMPDSLDDMKLDPAITSSPEPFQDTSYTYLPWSTADLDKLDSSETPLLWDHPDDPDDGITITFADSHVEHFSSPDQLDKFLQAAEDTLNNPPAKNK